MFVQITSNVCRSPGVGLGALWGAAMLPKAKAGADSKQKVMLIFSASLYLLNVDCHTVDMLELQRTLKLKMHR